MLRLIDEEYTRHPFLGSRRMVQFLRNRGLRVNRKRVQRLMQQLGLAGMAPALLDLYIVDPENQTGV